MDSLTPYEKAVYDKLCLAGFDHDDAFLFAKFKNRILHDEEFAKHWRNNIERYGLNDGLRMLRSELGISHGGDLHHHDNFLIRSIWNTIKKWFD